jgi:hypothetical protein
MMFAGFRSRWTTPRSCAAASLRKAADPAHERREILAVDVFHRQERVAFVFAGVIDTAHVRVRHLPRHADFGVQLRQARGIAVHGFGQELQGDLLSEFQVVRAIDLTHAPFAKASDDPVTVVEQSTGLEAPVIDGLGGREPAAAGGGPGRAGTALARGWSRCVRQPRGVRIILGHARSRSRRGF